MKKHLIILSTLIYFLTALTIPKKPIITTPQKIDWPFNYCKRNENEKKEDWKIEKLFFGSKPKKGYITEFFIVGTATNKTSFSVLLINIKLNGVFIHSQSVSLKNKYKNGDKIQFKYLKQIPYFIPAGTYQVTFTFKDQLDKDNGCLEFSFKI